MAIKVTVTVILGDDWITDEEADDVSDTELRELIGEDPIPLLEGAAFTFDRRWRDHDPS